MKEVCEVCIFVLGRFVLCRRIFFYIRGGGVCLKFEKVEWSFLEWGISCLKVELRYSYVEFINNGIWSDLFRVFVELDEIFWSNG